MKVAKGPSRKNLHETLKTIIDKNLKIVNMSIKVIEYSHITFLMKFLKHFQPQYVVSALGV